MFELLDMREFSSFDTRFSGTWNITGLVYVNESFAICNGQWIIL